jgi:S-adenosylmethionine decarboxylase
MLIRHLAARLEGCVRALLSDEKVITSTLDEIAAALEMHVLQRLTHRFNPEGVTAIYLIAESHIAFHSWPELSLIDLEIVSCKASANVLRGLEIAIRQFKPTHVEKRLWEYEV